MDPAVEFFVGMMNLIMQLMLNVLQQHIRRVTALRTRREGLIRAYQARSRAQNRRAGLRNGQRRAQIQLLSQMGGERRWWVYPRPSNWWRTYVMVIWEDEQWLEHFRMNKDTFQYIVSALQNRLVRQSTAMRDPISVEERVAITIWYLGNNTSYREVAALFGVGKSTVASIVVEVCLAMEAEMFSSIVRPGPPGPVMRGFAALGFPHCVGALDGCHINIRAPSEDPDAFYNRKQRHSVLLQATVDHRGIFTDACIGNVGRDHDSHVLRCSNFYDVMDAGTWVPGNPTLNIQGVQIPPLIVADGAYPLRRWLMTPYKGALNGRQVSFNVAHNRARSVVERAFGRLKARWRCLLLQLPVMEENVNSVICACVILHNICEERGHSVGWQLGGHHRAPIPDLGAHPVVVDARQRYLGEQVRNVLTQWIHTMGAR